MTTPRPTDRRSPVTAGRGRRGVLGLCLLLSAAVAAGPAGCAVKPSAADAEALDPRVAQRRGEELAYQAEQAAAANRREDAIVLYQQSLSIYNEHPAAWNNMGVLLQARGNNREAASAFLTASELNPRNALYPTNLGLLFAEIRQLDEASKWFDLALERDPGYLTALRESVKLDEMRARTTEQTLNRIRAALRLETDSKWKAYLLRQQDLVGARLRESGNLLGP